MASNLQHAWLAVTPDGVEIAYRLRRLGWKQRDIARGLGVTPSVVGSVIHGRKTAFPIADHIARLLDCQPQDLWPDRYCFRPRGPSPRRTAIEASSNAVAGEHPERLLDDAAAPCVEKVVVPAATSARQQS